MVSVATTQFSSLEWPELIEAAVRETHCAPAAALLQSLNDPAHWAVSPQQASQWQDESSEMSQLLEKDLLWGEARNLHDPESQLDRLRKAGILNQPEIACLHRWIRVSERWRNTSAETLELPLLSSALEALPNLNSVLARLNRAFDPEGELLETATSLLAELSQEIRSLKKEIELVMGRVTTDLGDRGLLQDRFSDIRDGRYVVPVKISSQNEIEGIVYEASVSRQTVYIEPREISALNNRLRTRQNQRLQEIDRILRELSEELLPHVSDLTNAISTITYWDAATSKARVGQRYCGKKIIIAPDRQFSLRNSAHPMLWWALPESKIIRNHFDFPTSTQTLLLTGPNTGGKTVCLKTLGLAGICARTGFPFPASEPAVVPFFETIFVDLGDQQSLAKHLSSFAGHLATFKRILENVTAKSLVLLDELNSATDPEEGAALGRALLETVMDRGGLVVSTTHDPHLKALATSDSRILCASLAFDEESRSPTYRVVLGVPGRSRALETAERMGLDPQVIARARSYLSTSHASFETAMTKLEQELASAADAHERATRATLAIEKLEAQWKERLGSGIQDLLQRTRHRLKHIFDEAQGQVRSTVLKLEEARSRKDIQMIRSSLTESLQLTESRIEAALSEESPEALPLLQEAPIAEVQAPALEKGAWVKVPKWKTHGTVISVQGSQVKVAMGSLQVTLSANEVLPVPRAESRSLQAGFRREETRKIEKAQASTQAGQRSQKSDSRISSTSPASTTDPNSEIDLRGLRFDDAMAQLRSYLDSTYRTGDFLEVRIIHGLGTGALREGTRKLLRSLPYIQNFRDGAPHEGSTGVTVAELDRPK